MPERRRSDGELFGLIRGKLTTLLFRIDLHNKTCENFDESFAESVHADIDAIADLIRERRAQPRFVNPQDPMMLL